MLIERRGAASYRQRCRAAGAPCPLGPADRGAVADPKPSRRPACRPALDHLAHDQRTKVRRVGSTHEPAPDRGATRLAQFHLYENPLNQLRRETL